ncbi:hypothetical protein GMST_14320 [Geomonas silvestris]|uniref:Uncharacterized protein n=2 Tax=Geomonas silvestris TaxID=2740184 RepID=A0A6V8MGL5_9BACT|nr:hypothetical protein GMST_14320 [Geomonas silvestris]
MPPDQKALNTFLGQRAAISGFVRHLREIHSVPITLPRTNRAKLQRKLTDMLEREMLAILRGDTEDNYRLHRWVALGLTYFHGVPRKVCKVALKEGKLERHEDGSHTLTWEKQDYWIPAIAKSQLLN